MIKGFIFDLDGVITDTAEYHYLAWKKLADSKGLKFDRKMNEQLKGISRVASLRVILEANKRSIGEEYIEEWATLKNSLYLESIKGITPEDLIPGVRELLEKLEEMNMMIALGSASKNAVEVIKRLGIEGKFHVIGDGHSVGSSKPAPDLFLYVAEKMGVKPSECIVVEDAQAGVQAAISAGMKVIGIGEEDQLEEADFNYRVTGEIEVDRVLKSL